MSGEKELIKFTPIKQKKKLSFAERI